MVQRMNFQQVDKLEAKLMMSEGELSQAFLNTVRKMLHTSHLSSMVTHPPLLLLLRPKN